MGGGALPNKILTYYIVLLNMSEHCNGTYNLLCGTRTNDNVLAIFVGFNWDWSNPKSNKFQDP